MSIRVVPLSAQWRAAAEAFNARMRAGGSPYGFYVEPDTRWLPIRPGGKAWREYYIAVDENGAVRGGFVLKPQEWIVRGESCMITDWQGPVSEGVVNPRYAALAVRLVREMLSRHATLYSWGHGGNEQPVVLILRKMGWLVHGTPFCLRILHPFRFLRLNGLLRKGTLRRAALDIAAFSGAGPLALRAVHALRRAWRLEALRAEAASFETFGPWADELWERCRGRYTAIAVRDAGAMNLIAPLQGWPPVTRLRVSREGATLGWALVMDTPMQGDARFGDLRVGSIVDCFAAPEDAAAVVAAATRFLDARGVDLVVSNQSHPAWIRGFARNGYLLLRNRRLFVASPALRERLDPFAETARGLHLTNMDGHGPHGL